MKFKYNLRSVALVAVFSLTTGAIAHAHHSHASLNKDDVRLYSGVVTRYSWTMPHVFLQVDAPDPDGKVVQYSIEMQHPPAMFKRGWTKESFKAGDRITWQGPHDSNLSRHYTGLTWAERGDGTRFNMEQNAEADAVPSTDFTGLWKRSDEGGFNPHYKPPVGWPMSTTGQVLIDGFDEDQNPMVTCGFPGPPKSMIIPYPILITRPDDNTVVIEGELNPNSRTVYLGDVPEIGESSIAGFSTGRMENDALIVETTNFVADRWGIHTGIDSSEQKKLVERFTLSDDGMYLHAEISVTDPVYLAKTHTFKHRWVKIADREVIQAPCTLEAAKLYLEAGFENTDR